MSQIMKQFKIFKKLVNRLKQVSDNTGQIDDICKYKEADEKLRSLQKMLAQFDETENIDEAYNKYADPERASTNSCVGGSQINFYNDEDEAQELILDEDKLTYRRSWNIDKNGGKAFETGEYTAEDDNEYQRIRKWKGYGPKSRAFTLRSITSDTVCLRYIMLIIVF